MKISTISKTLIAPTILLSAVACSKTPKTNLDFETKARENAIEYLTGEEYNIASRKAPHREAWFEHYTSSHPAMVYWDSILTKHKTEEAFNAGRKMVQDSVADKPYEKTEYVLPLNTRLQPFFLQYVDSLKAECSKYYNAKEFIKLEENVPKIPDGYYDNSLTNGLHYWSILARTGAERKAYNDGANAERVKLNKE